MTIENRAHGAPRDGHKQTGKETKEVVKHGKESRDCGVEGRDGPEDGAEVSGAGTVAQRTEKGTPVADPGGSIWRGVGGGGATDPRESGPGGQDAVRVAAAGIPRAIQRRTDPDTATADQALAGDGRTRAGSVLRPETRARAAVRVGLHAHGGVGDHGWGADVRASGVSLRADVLELGDGHDLLFGEPGEPLRRMAERGQIGRAHV